MQAAILTLIFSTVLVLYAGIAMAEVSDKVPAIHELWVECAILGLLAYLLVHIRWWAPLVFVPATLITFIGDVGIIHDPYVGPAIRHEQGFRYVLSVYGSGLLLAMGQIWGIMAGLRRRKKRASTACRL